MKKVTKELVAQAEKLGFELVGYTKNGHIKLRHKQSGRIVIAASTPSDHRGSKNTLALMRRIAREN